MPQESEKSPAKKAANPQSSPVTAPSDTQLTRTPPQGAGVEPKPFTFGAPPRYVKYNIATQVLADPAARMRFSQPYSGQRRLWTD